MESEYHILTVCPAYHAETALLRITYDILQVIDKHEDIILDLSAAFDTIDHQLLLNRLHQRFGFRDLALFSKMACFVSSGPQTISPYKICCLSE